MTVAILRVEGLFSTQLILDLPTVAAGFVSDVEVRIVTMDFVRGTIFPLIVLAFHVLIVTVVAI